MATKAKSSKKTAPAAKQNADTPPVSQQSKIELNVIDGKIAYLKSFAPRYSAPFRDTFQDGDVWRDTFSDGGQWVSNFNNLGAGGGGGARLRHPAAQSALDSIKKALAASGAKKSKS